MPEYLAQSARLLRTCGAVLFVSLLGAVAGDVSLAGTSTENPSPATSQPGPSVMGSDENAISMGGRGTGRNRLAMNAIHRQPFDRTPALVPVADQGHGHGMIELTGGNLPTVTLTALADGESGWNLRATLQNFSLAPQNASAAPVAGEGHMHLYVNGTKITRIYGEWFHLPALPEGEHELRLELSANDHSLLVVDGEPVAAITTITQPAATPHMHMGTMEDVPAAAGVTLDVQPDPKEGYAVYIQTTGFTLAPENASEAHVPGEGHVHLYVDDVKVARVYSDWFYLPALGGGEHVIRAELNTNDHRKYTADGVVIHDSVTVTADGVESAAGGHTQH